ncbi:MAG TPA: enoyl-CoA hydratase/isomerase family protein [Candidatus Dormibacteraeota bacterium]|nr:enoyl-CoA hydratase/isomerase family protein [Candidatus Dormibacteraeota bacterium]
MLALENVRVRTEGRVARVILDRPPLNVMNIAMMRELNAVVEELGPEMDFLVFQGAGEKGFSAGAEVADHTPEHVADMLHAFHGVFREIWNGRFITIAAVHGHCLGGGCELATFCDFVIAAESAKFGQPEIKLGCFPPVAMVTFPGLIGMRAAVDLILSGRTISAREAQRLGLASRVVADSDLENATASLLDDLGSLSPSCLGLARRTLWKAAGFDFERSLATVEELYLRDLMRTEDAQEGIRAFLEKRTPAWQGK